MDQDHALALYRSLYRLFPLANYCHYRGAPDLLRLKEAVSAFARCEWLEELPGRVLRQWEETDNNLMPLQAFELGIVETWLRKRRTLMSYHTNLAQERPPHKRITVLVEVSELDLKGARRAVLGLEFGSTMPQHYIAVTLNGRLELSYHTRSKTYFVAEVFGNNMNVEKFCQRWAFSPSFLKRGANEVTIEAKSPFLAHDDVHKDTLVDARCPALYEMTLELVY
jgi:hypothetical protein